MFHHTDLRCKVCGGLCSKTDWDTTRSCRSCIEFYDRSTEKMNRSVDIRKCRNRQDELLIGALIKYLFIYYFLIHSSRHFSYNCTCLENCAAKGSIQCNWNSGKRNHCKQCRYIKYQTSWIVWMIKYISASSILL